MSPFLQLGIFLTSLGAGGLGSMCGLGGGVIIVPVLAVLLGVPLKVAIAASAICVVINSLSGSIVYLKVGMVNVRMANMLQITTALGAVMGGLLVVFAPVRMLQFIFAITLYILIIAMMRPVTEATAASDAPDPYNLRGMFIDPGLRDAVSYIPQRLKSGVGLSALAGTIAGMLGIGGGVVQVPLMSSLMHVPLKAAAATSTFIVGITASVSAIIYYTNDLVDAAVTIPAAFGVILGSQGGARLGRYVRPDVLRRVLVVVLAILATMILFEAVGG